MYSTLHNMRSDFRPFFFVFVMFLFPCCLKWFGISDLLSLLSSVVGFRLCRQELEGPFFSLLRLPLALSLHRGPRSATAVYFNRVWLDALIPVASSNFRQLHFLIEADIVDYFLFQYRMLRFLRCLVQVANIGNQWTNKPKKSKSKNFLFS